MLQAPDRSAEGSRGAGECGRDMGRGGGEGALCFGGPGPLSQAVPSPPTHPRVSPTAGCWRRALWTRQGGQCPSTFPAPSQPQELQAAAKPLLAEFWKGGSLQVSSTSPTGTLGSATPREGSWDLGWHHPVPSLLCSGDAGGQDGTPPRWKSDSEANPSTSGRIPTPLCCRNPWGSCPCCLPHPSPRAALAGAAAALPARLAKAVLLLIKVSSFLFPSPFIFLLGFKNKSTVFLWNRASGVAAVKTLP